MKRRRRKNPREDDGTLLLWVGLGVAVLYFLASKFGGSAAQAAVAPSLPAPAGGASASTALVPSSSASVAAATAAANADAAANFDPAANTPVY